MISRIFVILAITLFAGCASNPMVVSTNQTLPQVSVEEAQVVFLRSSFVGSAINASLYDVTSGELEFIGILANATKIIHKTEPGKHTYMVVSESADFMEADIAAGKNYFSIATPRMGAWKARFSLWPIKADPSAKYSTSSPEFNNWVNNTKLVENSEKSKAWFENSKVSVKKKYEKYYPAWKEKSAEAIEQRTLKPEDGK